MASKTNLEYQQLIMKQAIARNLNDPQLANAPVVPTDRISLERLAEEDMPTEDLVKEAYVNNPQIEQAVLALKNNEITIKAFKNELVADRQCVCVLRSECARWSPESGRCQFRDQRPLSSRELFRRWITVRRSAICSTAALRIRALV